MYKTLYWEEFKRERGTFEWPGCSWENNIKIDLKNLGGKCKIL
jgi:hypothetical protein